MIQTPALQMLDSSLSELVSEQPVACQGEWSTRSRRVYASASQSAGEGPFVEVVDALWTGTLNAEFDFSVIAFLATSRETFWSKAPLVSTLLPVQIALSSYSGHTPQGSTFTGNVGGAFVPGVPVVRRSSLEDVCAAAPRRLISGRVTCLAETIEAELLVAVLPRTALKIGRNHLWRARDEFAARLPATVREVLTRRRSGTIRHETANGLNA